MALTGILNADFTSFVTAVQGAELKLRSFESGAAKVETQLNRVADSLSGRKLIADATLMAEAVERIGGAAKLTEGEQNRVNRSVTEAIEKYRALGQTAPKALHDLADATRPIPKAMEGIGTQLRSMAGLLGVTFSVGAVVGFGRELLRMGDDIVRVADRTGLLTDEVQKLSFIAGQSGNTLEEMTGAIGQMQNRLASGDDSAVGALKRLNISFDELRAAAPYQQMELIAEAVAKIPNPATRAQVAMDLFGRSGIAILPTLTGEFKRLGDEAPKMSEKTVRSLEQAGDALDKFQLSIKVFAAESYNFLSRSFDRSIIRIYTYIAELEESTAKVYSLLQKIPGSATAFPGIEKDIKGLTESAKWFRDAAAAMALQTERTTTAVRAAAPPFEVLGKAAKAVGDHVKASAAAMKDTAAIAPELQHALDLLAVAHQHEAAALQFEASAFRASQKAAEDYIKHLPTAAIMGTRNLSSLVPQIGAAAANAGNLSGSGGSASSGFFASLFGSAEQMGAQLSATILAAVQGGGSPVGAATSLVGSKIGSSIAGSLTKEGGKLFQTALGGILNSALPVVGSLIGPLASKLWNSLFGTAGRTTVVDFANSLGGFDALHVKLNALGAEGERLWIRLTQGVGRNNPKEAQAAIDAVNAALERYRLAQERAGAEATAAGEAQAAATAKAQAAVDALTSKIESLQQSIANEAPEEVMGIIEAQTRAEIKAIELQRAAAMAAIGDITEHATDAAKEAGDIIDRALRNREFRIRVKVDLDTPGGGGVPSFAGGSGGRYLNFGAGTLAMLHGREKIVTAGERETGGGGVQHITLMMPDGEVLLRQVVKASEQVIGPTS